MTHAELLRKHATEATNEGGIWFSGPYMDVLAKVAESLESENAKLRELVQYICDENYGDDWFAEKAAELGIEAHY